jgi:hypothetical protein
MTFGFMSRDRSRAGSGSLPGREIAQARDRAAGSFFGRDRLSSGRAASLEATLLTEGRTGQRPWKKGDRRETVQLGPDGLAFGRIRETGVCRRVRIPGGGANLRIDFPKRDFEFTWREGREVPEPRGQRQELLRGPQAERPGRRETTRDAVQIAERRPEAERGEGRVRERREPLTRV